MMYKTEQWSSKRKFISLKKGHLSFTVNLTKNKC